MQILRMHTIAVLIAIVLIVIVVVSAVVLIQNTPQPTPTSTPSPTAPPLHTPAPTGASPAPTATATTVPSVAPPITSPPSGPSGPTGLLPGEVTQYQNQNLTPISTYIQYLIAHPDVAIKGTQNVDPATYRLAITGMVNNPTNFTYDQIVNGFNSTQQVATLPCVEGWSVTLLWQGVPITDILNQTGVGPDANTLIFLAADGYSSSLPLQYVKDNNIMIAYKMNNVTFTPQLGWPFFLVAKGQYGYKWVEWVTEINVSNDSNYLGYWESRGYPNDASVPNASSVASPGNGVPVVLAVVAAGVVSVVLAAVFYSRHVRRKRLAGFF